MWRWTGRLWVPALIGGFGVLGVIGTVLRQSVSLPDASVFPLPAEMDPGLAAVGVAGWVLVGLGSLGILGWAISAERSRVRVRRRSPRRKKSAVRAPQVYMRTVVYSGGRTTRPVVRRQYYR